MTPLIAYQLQLSFKAFVRLKRLKHAHSASASASTALTTSGTCSSGTGTATATGTDDTDDTRGVGPSSSTTSNGPILPQHRHNGNKDYIAYYTDGTPTGTCIYIYIYYISGVEWSE